ncbi:MAG: hypothetical protein Q3965_03215 [Rothia sp. (in: high G+C Gram-positive bacteria)]|nr:hypothetical protein [Rothia sp. (in: high G+C Gram-positive bacteria)]
MSALPLARSRSERFVDAYNALFCFLVFLAIAAALAYSLRQVRGSYLYFILTDQQAFPFFAGALLICSAGFAAILYILGPVAYSPSDLFWRFSGDLPAHRLWRRTETWVVLALWGLTATLLATVFAPFSTVWLVGTGVGTLIFGIILMQGALACQLLGRKMPVLLWSAVALALGTGLVLLATTPLGTDSNLELLAPTPAGAWVLCAVLGSLCLSFARVGIALEWKDAVTAYGRSSVLLYALRNVGGAEGYRYFGSSSVRYRRRVTSASAVKLSLAALADSLLPLLLTFLVTLPFAIFLGVGFGAAGAGVVLALGSWATASFYRWLTREWAANQALRQWMGAPYLGTLLGFSVASALATGVYVLGMALIFQLPVHLVAAGLMFGFAIALGEVDPATQFNYDLTITTIEGLSVPIEPIAAVLKTLGLLVLMMGSFLAGGAITVLLPALFLVARFLYHVRSAR